MPSYKDWLARREVKERLKTIEDLVCQILKNQEVLMATVDELSGKLDAIPPVLDAIAADVQAQKDEIQALKDQLAGGVPVTQEQLDSLDSKAGAILERVQGIDSSVP